MAARVKRGPAPSGVITQHNYRDKALESLIRDFKNRCAYCMESGGLRHHSENQIDHFDPHLPPSSRNEYANLMLSCPACNLSKRDKSVANPYDTSQRMLNCTLECEFPEHITEEPDGSWKEKTPQGKYHIACMDLNESSHILKRKIRHDIAQRLIILNELKIQYSGTMKVADLQALEVTLTQIREELKLSPPLPTDRGVMYFDGRRWVDAES